MGQKIHPLGFRVGITKRHQTVWFARFQKRQYAQTVLEDIFLRKTLHKLLPELLKKKYTTADQAPKIAEIKIERGLIPYEIGIQIYTQNCEALKTAIDKLEVNPDVFKSVLKHHFLLEKASLKSQNVFESSKTTVLKQIKLQSNEVQVEASNEAIGTKPLKNPRKNSRVSFLEKRLTKKQTTLETFRQRILENMLIIKKGKKITRQLQNPEAKASIGKKRFGKSFVAGKTSFQKKPSSGMSVRSKFVETDFGKKQNDFANFNTTRLRSLLTENREQAQKTTKFMNTFLSKTNQNFTRLLKSELQYWNTFFENYKQEQIQKFGKLQSAPFGYQMKWSLTRFKRYENQPVPVLIKLLKLLQKQALRKLEVLRKEFFVLGTISKMKTFAYFQRIRFIKALKSAIHQAKLEVASKQKQSFLGLKNSLADQLNSQKQKENEKILKTLKEKAFQQKLTNLKNETRKIQFIEQLQHFVQKHRQKNLYLYLGTIADSRKYLRQIQKFTKQQASFLFGLNTNVLEQLSSEQKREFIKNQLKKTLQKANRSNESQRTLQEVFVRQLQQQKFICQQNLALMPKISLKFYSVKPETIETNAAIITASIVDKLEKREAFRRVIKKISEDLMKTNKVKGVKIQVSGRLNGAEIARSEWVRAGRVPLQTLRANIDYCYKTAQTIYGIIGVKVWIYRGYTKKNRNA
jgi:ribosomal protein S3